MAMRIVVRVCGEWNRNAMVVLGIGKRIHNLSLEIGSSPTMNPTVIMQLTLKTGYTEYKVPNLLTCGSGCTHGHVDGSHRLIVGLQPSYLR